MTMRTWRLDLRELWIWCSLRKETGPWCAADRTLGHVVPVVLKIESLFIHGSASEDAHAGFPTLTSGSVLGPGRWQEREL
jgi:hypothetical protein